MHVSTFKIYYIRRYIFLFTGIKNFTGVYAHGLPDAALVAHRAGYHLFRHMESLLKTLDIPGRPLPGRYWVHPIL